VLSLLERTLRGTSGVNPTFDEWGSDNPKLAVSRATTKREILILTLTIVTYGVTKMLIASRNAQLARILRVLLALMMNGVLHTLHTNVEIYTRIGPGRDPVSDVPICANEDKVVKGPL